MAAQPRGVERGVGLVRVAMLQLARRTLARVGGNSLTRGRCYSTLLTECSSAGVLKITLNRPDALNAFTLEMRDEIIDAMSANVTNVTNVTNVIGVLQEASDLSRRLGPALTLFFHARRPARPR